MKTRAKTKIDWDKLDAALDLPGREFPPGAVTAQDVAKRYMISVRHAHNKMAALVEAGRYEMIRVYSAARGRNPYNEIECSDHYARAGASHAVFLALCGFHFDQSKGLLRFDPVIQKDNFKAPFTTSAAWGTYEQTRDGATITITHGTLRLESLDLPAFAGRSMRMTLNGKAAPEGEIQLAEGDILRCV